MTSAKRLRLAARKPGAKRLLRWSGYDWAVRPTTASAGPGPCSWSDTPLHASVDPATDALTVSIAQDGSTWNSVELVGPHLGYGKYSFTLSTDPAGIDIRPVLGLFTYDDTDNGTYAYREIDMEVTKWDWAPEPSRMWYTVQPTSEPMASDHGLDTGIPYLCEFTWQSGQVYFRTLDQAGNLLGEHLVTQGVFAPGAETIRVNLWISGGTGVPSDGQPCSMTLNSFAFTPGATFTPPAAASKVSTFTSPGMDGIALKTGATIVAGVLTMACTHTDYSVAYSGGTYKLTGSQVDVCIVGMPAIGNGSTEAQWFVRYDASNYFSMFISGGDLYSGEMYGGSKTNTLLVSPYDATSHKYWRVREASGTVYFDTSPDRVTWTNMRSHAHTLSTKLATMRMWFECGYYGTETAPDPLRIDAINTD